MSLFKKSNRKFRQRLQHSDSDSSEESESQGAEGIQSEGKSEKSTAKTPLLSFTNEEDGEAEVFKVRKSQYSRRIQKQMERERKRKVAESGSNQASKSDGESRTETTSVDPNRTAITTDRPFSDELEIKIKNTIKILNSEELRETELGGSSEGSDGEAELKFRSRVDRILSGKAIPDAATIYALKKQRQLARQVGTDFIPLEAGGSHVGMGEAPASTQHGAAADDDDDNHADDDRDDAERKMRSKPLSKRLIREEDEEDDDDERRISFGVSKESKGHRIAQALAASAQHDSEDECGDAVSLRQKQMAQVDRWERQQIQKGLSQLRVNQDPEERSPTRDLESPPPDLFQKDIPRFEGLAYEPPLDRNTITTESILKRITDRMEATSEVALTYQRQKSTLDASINETIAAIEALEAQEPKLKEAFRFYQEMRDYVVDLVDCLNSKLPVILALEGRMMCSWVQRSEKLIARRRQDVKDQSEECANMAKSSSHGLVNNGDNDINTSNRDPLRQRRTTERDGRRLRRKRQRETNSLTGQHFEGLSTDDEEHDSDLQQFNADKEVVLSDAIHVFEDVVEGFGTLRGIVEHFSRWKCVFGDTYAEAYIPLCLIKIVTPFVRLELLDWNPLENPDGLDGYAWYNVLLFYGEAAGDQEADPDECLIPRVVERVVLPKIAEFVEKVWDPLSSRQTLNVVRCIKRLVEEYPNVSGRSKYMHSLLVAVTTRMQKSIDDDLYVPMYSKEILDNRSSLSALFFHRQFWSALKLMQNILCWSSILNELPLRELALTSLLNRYLLFALQCSMEQKETLDKCKAIVSSIPSSWLKQTPPLLELTLFIRFMDNFYKHLRDSGTSSESIREAQNMLELLQNSLESSSSFSKHKTKKSRH